MTAQTNKQTSKQKKKQTNTQTNRQTNRHTYKQANKQTNKQMFRFQYKRECNFCKFCHGTNKRTNEQTQTDKQAHTRTSCILTCIGIGACIPFFLCLFLWCTTTNLPLPNGSGRRNARSDWITKNIRSQTIPNVFVGMKYCKLTCAYQRASRMRPSNPGCALRTFCIPECVVPPIRRTRTLGCLRIKQLCVWRHETVVACFRFVLVSAAGLVKEPQGLSDARPSNARPSDAKQTKKSAAWFNPFTTKVNKSLIEQQKASRPRNCKHPYHGKHDIRSWGQPRKRSRQLIHGGKCFQDGPTQVFVFINLKFPPKFKVVRSRCCDWGQHLSRNKDISQGTHMVRRRTSNFSQKIHPPPSPFAAKHRCEK